MKLLMLRLTDRQNWR